MGAAQSNQSGQPFKNLVECRVEATSDDVESQIWFNTPPITQELLDRLETIQLKTVSHNEMPETPEEDLQLSWFELVIYRSWDRSRPRINLATKRELVWRSHSTPAYEDDNGVEAEGPIFERGHEIFKEIEAGDVIAVQVCAQSGCVNYAIKGEIDVKFKDEVSPLAPTTYTVYPYSSVGPCYVHSTDHVMVSKLWFSTPPLDKNTIDRLSEIQLFTESRDQGWADDDSWSYSWFELVVLRSQDDTTPLLHNNYELAWRSHGNEIRSSTNKLLEGRTFNRDDDLLRGLLVEGNSIGVRVCARFAAWRNLATEGRLELRFSEPVTRTKPVKPGKAADAAAVNMKLIELFEKMYPDLANGQTEIDRVVADQIKEPMQWDGDYGLHESKLSILSFDGGGVRGLSSLLILAAIMEHVKGPNGETLKPYECFDLIGGTSTGGLIAIMLGRLHMSAQQCIDEYKALATKVFGKGTVKKRETLLQRAAAGITDFFTNTSKAAKLVANSYLFNAETLQDVVQDVVKRHEPGGQGRDATMLDTSAGCRVAVFACYAKDISNTDARHFRTYRFDNEDRSFEFKIWEAARATTAAPAYFERISLGGEDYVDGGLQVNNPVIPTLAEGMVSFGKARTVGCLLSIGTGLVPAMNLHDNQGVLGGMRNLLELGKALFGLATNSQLAHSYVTQLNGANKLSEEYFRFNADVGIPKQGDPDLENKIISLDDVASLEKFQKMTEDYLKTDKVQKDIIKCAGILSALYRQKNHHS
ncbi:hypothetical protein FRC10_000586 [Ceratobasidium sp. 414]|nr:hypothetical protein FRC10_000586 [Ceratobasidium sp. 414]